MAKKLLFSVTMKDLEMQTFSVGGHGGGGKDTSNSGVRLIHKESGAVGEGREHRSNTQNRRSAFRKLVETHKFQAWVKYKAAKLQGYMPSETPEQVRARVDRMVDEGLKDGSILVEGYEA